MATFLSNTAVSVHDPISIPTASINRKTVSLLCIRYGFGDPPGCCDPPGLPRRLLPRNRRLDFGFPSPVGADASPFLGGVSFFAAGCPATLALLSGLGPCRLPSGFRLPLPPRRFFLLRSSRRVRLSWPTTFS